MDKQKITAVVLLIVLIVLIGQWSGKIALSLAGMVLLGAIIFNVKNYTTLLS